MTFAFAVSAGCFISRQRSGIRVGLIIARSLLRNPTLLTRYEPISAINYEGERLIRQAFDITVK